MSRSARWDQCQPFKIGNSKIRIVEASQHLWPFSENRYISNVSWKKTVSPIQDRLELYYWVYCMYCSKIEIAKLSMESLWRQTKAHAILKTKERGIIKHLPACNGWQGLVPCTAFYGRRSIWSAWLSGAEWESSPRQILGCNTWRVTSESRKVASAARILKKNETDDKFFTRRIVQ